MQTTTASEKGDDSLIHLIFPTFIDHFGIGQHLECRLPELVLFV